MTINCADCQKKDSELQRLHAMVQRVAERVVNPAVSILPLEAWDSELGRMNIALEGLLVDTDALRDERDRYITERDAARANHLKVMHERDAAYSLLDKLREAHTMEHRWGEICSLCIAAQRMARP
jgi:hypothetical protein